MARVTVEDCLENVPNRFELIHLAAKRVRQLAKGSRALIPNPNNKSAVIALREIAGGKVFIPVSAEAQPSSNNADTDSFTEES